MNYDPPPSTPEPFDPTQDKPAFVPQAVRVALPESAPYVTYSIIGFTVFIHVLQLISIAVFGRFSGGIDLLEIYGAMIINAIRAGELWRLITPVLLHDNQSLLHIMLNMYSLSIIGAFIERNFGYKRLLFLYLLGGFSGNVVGFLFSNSYSYSVGASTAIFGLIGAEAVFFHQNRKLFADQFKRIIGNLIFIVVINLVVGSSIGAGNWGHIGGLLGGLIFTWFAGPLLEIKRIQPYYHLVDKRPSREVIIGAATVLFIFGGLAIWGLVR